MPQRQTVVENDFIRNINLQIGYFAFSIIIIAFFIVFTMLGFAGRSFYVNDISSESLPNRINYQEFQKSQRRNIKMPNHEDMITDDLYYLGKVNYNGYEGVRGYMYAHSGNKTELLNNNNNNTFPNNHHNLKKTLEQNIQCTGPISEGTRWKISENYFIDTTNNNGLTNEFIIETFSNSINTWKENLNFDFINENIIGSVDGIDIDSPDGKNEVIFTNFQEENVLAITILWGIFDGPVSGRFIFEWDMIFNDNFPWCDVQNSQTSNCVDFQSIATHEIGHVAGLRDIFDNFCSDVTMFFSSSFGEIKKRTLTQSDILGLQILYQEVIIEDDDDGFNISPVAQISISTKLIQNSIFIVLMFLLFIIL